MFHNRINRRTYAAGLLVNLLFLFTIILILYIDGDALRRIPDIIKVVASLILIFVEIAVCFSLNTRRWHDIGREGWSGFAEDPYLLFRKGQREENKFGKPPDATIDFKSLVGL